MLKSDADIGIAEDCLKTQTEQSLNLSVRIHDYLLQNPDNIKENLENLHECSNIIEKFCLSLAEDCELFLIFISNPIDLAGILNRIPKYHDLLIDKLISDDGIFDAIVPTSKKDFRHILETLCMFQQKNSAMKLLDYIIERDGLLEELILTKDPSTISNYDALMNFMSLNMLNFDIVNEFIYQNNIARAYRINFANLVFNKIYTAAFNNEAIFNKAFSHMSQHIFIINFFSWQEGYLDKKLSDQEVAEGLFEIISELSEYATNILKTTLIDKGMLKRILSHWIEIVALAEVIPEGDMSDVINIILKDEELCRRICHQTEDLSRALFLPKDDGTSICGDHRYIPHYCPIQPLTDFYPCVVPLLEYMNESERELIEKVTVQKNVIKETLNDYLLKNLESLQSIRNRQLANGGKNLEDDEIALKEKTNNNNSNDDDGTSSFGLTLSP